MTRIAAFPSVSVRGLPYTEGSLVAFNNKNGGRPIVRHDRSFELTRWRNTVAAKAVETWGLLRIAEPVFVIARFVTPVASKSYHVKDTDKLERAILDSLQIGEIVVDDKWVKRTLSMQDEVNNLNPFPGVEIHFGYRAYFESVAIELLSRTSEPIRGLLE